MDLELDESQRLLADTFGHLLTSECPPALVRETEESGFSPALWERLAAVGALGMALPTSVGGVEAEMLELGIVATACGRTLAPVPFAEVATASRLLAGQLPKAPLLERIAAGEERISIAPHPRAIDPARGLFVPAGRVARHVVALDGDELILWTRANDGRPLERIADLGDGAHAFWPMNGADAPTRRLLGRGASARRAFDRGVAEWKLLVAFGLVGLARQALAIGAEYARGREQFGAPIGSFQAIAQPLADCATRVDGAELLVREAAWAERDAPERFEELCSMAFVFASQTARRTTAVSLHTHGGYGVSLEYDIQLHYRRACAWSLVAGGARQELQHLADLQLGGPIDDGGAA